ncbi:linear gramicidin synthetase LgrC [Sphingopyxis sp. FD7]|nr:linear gramicidin synthetase LgrC [Sphingopyxis sp. FD7]
MGAGDAVFVMGIASLLLEQARQRQAAIGKAPRSGPQPGADDSAAPDIAQRPAISSNLAEK